MSKLKGRAPITVKAKKPLTLIYGAGGVGKTWAALDWPNVFYIDSEEGATNPQYVDKLVASGATYFGPDDGALDIKTLTEQMEALATEDHDRLTVVWDSGSESFNEEIMRQAKILGSKNGYGADKKAAIAEFKPLMNWFYRLNMNRIMICHEKPAWIDDKQVGFTYDGHDKWNFKFELALHVTKTGQTRYAQVKKTRYLGFPDGDKFVFSFEEMQKRFGAAVIKEKGEVIHLATAERVAELRRLCSLLRVNQTDIDAWLDKAHAERLEQLTVDQVEALITMLNKKAAA